MSDQPPSSASQGRTIIICVLALAVAIVVIALVRPSDEAGPTGLTGLTGPTGPTGPVGVFPVDGTRSASPATEISFRGVERDDLEEVEVAGARSGVREGEVREHADANGASIVFDEPFEAGERVTVSSDLELEGGADGEYSFRTLARPKEGLGSGSPPPPALLRQFLAQQGEVPDGAVPRYRSRPDVRPPEVEIRQQAGPGVGDGLVFIAPKKVFGTKERPGLQAGAMIVDDDGEPVWFAGARDTATQTTRVNDFRVQEYEGKPVLTWWQGRQVLGTGEGEIVLADESYERVARVRAGNGYQFDFHEVRLTDRGSVLSLVYNPVDADLRSVGGPKDGRVIDAIVQEVEISTGRVLFEWHSLGNIDFADSYAKPPEDRSTPYDYFHVNSVAVDDDGNLLISGRDTWQVLKVDRDTGETIWTLGGKSSDFKLPDEAVFAYQHDVQRAPDGTIRIFDNEAAPKVRERSRVLWLELDEATMRASISRMVEHPDRLLAGTQGNAQALPDGTTFVGWGSQGYFSEFDADGELIFDARVARGNDTYRAYRSPWVGQPDDDPAVAAAAGRRGRVAVYASWNGATEVARWEVLAGESADDLEPVGDAERDGFETRIVVRSVASMIAVRALDDAGEELGVSKPVNPRKRG
ncbi:MAG: arylsulfotransferase family protein [Solirubrobacteraceae bacterium]